MTKPFKEWDVQKVQQWLRTDWGLSEEILEKFCDDDVVGDRLLDLNEFQLSAYGVKLPGVRRGILNELKSAVPAAVPVASPVSPPTITLQQFLSETTLPSLHKSLTRTGTNTTKPTWPRTDMKTLEPWTDFEPNVIAKRSDYYRYSISRQYMETPEDVTSAKVTNEENVRSFADYALHTKLARVMKVLGHDGYEISDIGGNSSVICDPDRLIVYADNPKPLATIEFKTPWAFSKVNDLPSAYKAATSNSKVRRAVNQIYGYMTFNHHRYGVLTSYNHTYFLRRQYSTEGGYLQVAGPVSFDQKTPCTLLEAYTTFLLMCQANWFYASPTTSPIPSVPVTPASSRPTSPHLTYELQELNLNSVSFSKGRDRSRMGTVVEGTMFGKECVMKVIDATKHPEDAENLANEVSQYRNLEKLQGTIIPNFIGYGIIWNMLHVLGMEDGGTSVAKLLKEGFRDAQKLQNSCKSTLDALHKAGLQHGDVRLENFVFSEASGCRVVDLEHTRTSTDAEKSEELDELKSCFDCSD